MALCAKRQRPTGVVLALINKSQGPQHPPNILMKRLLQLILALSALASVGTAQMFPNPTTTVGGSVAQCGAATGFPLGAFPPNGAVLSQQSPAAIGDSWVGELSVTGHAPSVATLFLSTGRVNKSLPGGLLQIDVAQIAGSVTLPHDGVTPLVFSLPVPDDTALCGQIGYIQAVVLGAPQYELSTTYKVTVGR